VEFMLIPIFYCVTMKKLLFTIFALSATLCGFSQGCSTCNPAYSSAPNLAFDVGPANIAVTDDIVITGTGLILSDLNVYVEIDHSSNIDFSVTLTNVESGISAALYIGSNLGCGDTLAVEYDDEGPAYNCDADLNPSLSGCMVPNSPLNVFDNIAFDGTWTMTVSDQLPVIDNGVFKNWCLIPTGGGGSALAPACATTPLPSDTLKDVCNLEATLSFTAPAPAATPAQDPAGYNLSLWTSNGAIAYLHKDTNLLTATSFDIPDVLTPGETYYWQVKPYNDLGTNEGCAVWSFTTATKPNPVPVIDVDGNAARLVEVCSNFDFVFNVTDLNGTPYTGATFDWDGTDNTSYPLSDTTITNPTFNSTDFGTTYQLALMIVDEFGCVGVDSVDVTVNETATTGSISSIEGTKICDGEFANLSLTGYSPAGTIEWKKSIVSPTGSLATTDDFDDNHMAGPITQDIYYVAIVDLNGCLDSTNVFIEKEELPFKPAISSESTIFCEGDSVQLTVVWPDAGDFEWNDADMSTTSAIWVKDAASYHVTGTASSNGCSNTSTDIVITEGVKPNNPAIVVNSGTPCIGEALNITAEISGAASMERFVDYAFSETYDADQDFEISDDVIYQFVNKSADDCPSDTIDYIIVFNETPERPAVSVLNKKLHVNAIATSYDWYLEDGTLMGTTTDTVFDPSVDGVYYVVAKNDPCISLPSETAVVDWVIGINEYGTPGFNVTIYPNPVNNLVNVIVENNISTLILTDVSGKVIVTKALTQGANTLELFVEKGIYLITVSNGNSSVVEKLIVE
jgi:hypothetical protein